jgi:uncharacterized lipoprotein YddW (UPF0748 family)
MKRRVLFCFVCIVLAFLPRVFAQNPVQRGLLVSMVQSPQVLSSPQEITKLLDFAKKARIATLFVQIYHANQAWFPSQTADDSLYKAARQRYSEDTFTLLIREAHAQGMQVHAWLNLLSLGNNRDARFLKKYGADILTSNLREKKKLEDYKVDEQYFLEPGDSRVRRELVKVISEVLKAYPEVDGLLFDYIRYPDLAPHYGYSTVNMKRFKQASGLKTIEDDSWIWKNWKRDQVTQLLSLLVKKARKLRPHIYISTTGCLPCVRAYEEAFQDWPSWLSQGLVDSVMLMDYSPVPSVFHTWFEDAVDLIKDLKRLKIAIGAYRLGKSPEVFGQEWRQCEELGAACVVFHYGSLQDSQALSSFL